jgi:erythromycin esterase
VLQSETRQSTTNGVERVALRDRFMADNAMSLLEMGGPGAKIMVWAHNGHAWNFVGEGEDEGLVSMGHHLKQEMGGGVRLVGFDFYRGAFNARRSGTPNMEAFPIEASLPGSYAHGFHSTGLPAFFLDLRGVARGTEATDWLFGPRQLWSVGAVYHPGFTDQGAGRATVSLPETFDAVIFIDTISPTHLK